MAPTTAQLATIAVVWWAVVLVVGFAVRDRLAGRRPVDRHLVSRLGAYEVAFLAGGPNRVKLTVLASLVEDGQLRPAGCGFDLVEPVAPTDPAAPSSALRDRALDEARADRRGGWTSDYVLTHLSDDLRSLLEVPPAELSAARPLALRWLPLLATVGVWIAVDRGIGLTIMLGLAALVLVGMVRLDLSSQPMVDARRRVVAAHLGPVSAGASVAMLVARGGTGALARRSRRAYRWQLDSGSG